MARKGPNRIPTGSQQGAGRLRPPCALSFPSEAASVDSKDIDDAVLQMAMAMSEEDEKQTDPARAKTQDSGFEWSSLVSVFWTILIVYSFGSSFIALSQGRVQDRTGGEFTAYDFFDNIFAFKEWSFEYTLGFDPFKVWAQMTGKAPEPTDLDL
ncbi:unnamed protein product [Prorocentrum cordatum]|uniref:Uncharacterized protein n=1 Tax=Prorocentrum cordatum TaxID=2364126 RepID=A0ABN9W0H5_9DINO|nr:unnamed protein product [Polarella glacialis]